MCKTAQIKFRGKVKARNYVDGSFAYEFLSVPQFRPSHCDMAAFRVHPRYDAFANSALFGDCLAKIRRTLFEDGILRLNSIPDGVTIDRSGFLAEVTITL